MILYPLEGSVEGQKTRPLSTTPSEGRCFSTKPSEGKGAIVERNPWSPPGGSLMILYPLEGSVEGAKIVEIHRGDRLATPSDGQGSYRFLEISRN